MLLRKEGRIEMKGACDKQRWSVVYESAMLASSVQSEIDCTHLPIYRQCVSCPPLRPVCELGHKQVRAPLSPHILAILVCDPHN
jgi:hypothetical protein